MYNTLNLFLIRHWNIFRMFKVIGTRAEYLSGCCLSFCFRQPGQLESSSFEKCFARMNYLSEDMSAERHHNLRVIMANQGPSCFLATCLVELCPNLRPSDVVVVSADEGLSYINALSEKTSIPVSQISGPPVWGFIGLYSFVDEGQTMFKTDVYRPNAGSLTAPRGSTLPLGTIKSELRLMSYLINDHDETERVVQKKKEKMTKALERPAVLAKIKSLISLLKLWYAEPSPKEIISLGVCSNGSFDIPPGIVFSQPVMLDAKKRWVPYTEFPMMNEFTKKKISECVEPTTQLLKRFNLLHHFCRDDVDICSNPDCPMIIAPEG